MANKTLLAQVKQRSDTAANWTAKNPIIGDGELIVVTTSAGEKRFKVGDGEKTFTQLPYTDERIFNNVVTSVNGQTGDVTLNTSGEGGAAVQSDWQQGDSTAIDYIKNKTGGYDAPVSFDITWDGNIEGETVVKFDEGTLSSGYWWYCPELSKYSVEDLNGAIVEYTYYDNNNQIQKIELPIYGKMFETDTEFGLVYAGNLFDDKEVINSDDNDYMHIIYYTFQDNVKINNGAIFPKKGYYFFVGITTSIDGINTPTYYPSHIYQSSAPRMFDLKYMPYWPNFNITIDETGGISANYKEGNGISISMDGTISTIYKAGRGISIQNDGTILTTTAVYKAGNGISISSNGTISVTAAKMYSGANAPANTLGDNGDVYIQTEG